MRELGVHTVAAAFGARLRDEGIHVVPGQSTRFARAVDLLRPRTNRELYRCGLATLVTEPGQIPLFDRVFRQVFEDISGVTGTTITVDGSVEVSDGRRTDQVSAMRASDLGDFDQRNGVLAGDVELLCERDFAELSDDELEALTDPMRQLRLVLPYRKIRRSAVRIRGRTVDLRATLRVAGRTAGLPVALRRRQPKSRPRRLVMLCDISGSMSPYTKAILQLLCFSAGGLTSDRSAEVFTFATRLTRLTGIVRKLPPRAAIERAGRAAPDWSGGTRIATNVAEFLATHGARGMARGAVVVVVSDGWDTDEPSELGRQMARLSRLAYSIVWANPRTASPRYRPLAGGMAAAWPYCDRVVSAHNLTALDELADAIRAARDA